MTGSDTDKADQLARVDRRMRSVLRSYGYAPNNDLIAQLVEACNPLIESEKQKMLDSIFIDIPTGHAITKMTTVNAKHDEPCSSWDGMMCDCEILNAAVFALEETKKRLGSKRSKS